MKLKEQEEMKMKIDELEGDILQLQHLFEQKGLFESKKKAMLEHMLEAVSFTYIKEKKVITARMGPIEAMLSQAFNKNLDTLFRVEATLPHNRYLSKRRNSIVL